MAFVTLVLLLTGLMFIFSGIENISLLAYAQSFIGGSTSAATG